TSINTPLPQGNIADIAFDTLGNKWIATEQGLYKYDGTTWTVFDTSNTAMMGNWVNSLLMDNNGTLWVGCEEAVFPPYPAGLCSYDGTTWTPYTTSNSGLQEKFVRRMALDTLGNIWVMSRGKGAAIFNPGGIIGYDCMDKTLQTCISTGVSESIINSNSPLTVFPNPFSTSTTLTFNLEKAETVSINIYDVTGRKTKTVFTGNLSTGKQEIKIDAEYFTSGIYFCEVKTASQTFKTKLIIQ
ncbi:MAG: T9SS type A sorting domain-containing protein, partial [Bacteroidota bacterium]